VWRLVDDFDGAKAPAASLHERLRHRTIKQVHLDLERMQFNTAVARLMEYVNALVSGGASGEDLAILVKLLAPYAPHIADEAWERLGRSGFVVNETWPVYDEALTQSGQVTIVVQVNGKLRGEFTVPLDTGRDELHALALAAPKVKPHIEGKIIRKVIVVPNKLVNIVAG
jgi:leucyl-tRNA synthetase